MKVLDLQCSHEHVFEGWFASEGDFLDQQGQGLVECPVCGDASIVKKLSAPRLNLGGARLEAAATSELAFPTSAGEGSQGEWMAMAHRILANTEDVGDRFPEEARKIHYGESKARGIRGRASPVETEALIEEGIAVLPLSLPTALKGQLQ